MQAKKAALEADTTLTEIIGNAVREALAKRRTPLDIALGFTNRLREDPGCVLVSPGEHHWEIFTRLCKAVGAKGNLISDAFFAALAIESGAERITADRDYARLSGLRWRHPLS